jgi:tetratricopeptide (TPR) repeat protein
MRPRTQLLPFGFVSWCLLIMAWSTSSESLSRARDQGVEPSVATALTNRPEALASFQQQATTNPPAGGECLPGMTNSLVASPTEDNGTLSAHKLLALFQAKLEFARKTRLTTPQQAEPLLVELLGREVPEAIQRMALLELAQVALDQEDLPRAQQIYAQFLNRWPSATQTPEVLLHQGQLFRRMGLNNLALAKFYAVMTSALVMKQETLEYYRRLVLLAQTEIAETHFQLGKYAEAADFFSRLLKQNPPALNRATTQFRYLRALAALGRSDEVVAQAQDFLSRYPETPDQPEVRFELAQALKQLGRNNEALQQVLALLQEQRRLAHTQPELWAYWQQRAGNEIANQLYREGDYTHALEIYLALAKLDSHAAWQLPVTYQIGLTYERLAQPAKALQSYQEILRRQPELGTNTLSSLNALLEMARWRADFVRWQSQAENRIHTSAPAAPPSKASLQ